MRTRLAVFVCLAAVLALALNPTSSLADDNAAGTPHGVVPLNAPPAPRQVPVPDVRGMDEAGARRALAEGGLTLGGIERVSLERLRSELGQTYALGTVVQQAPRPSTGNQPSWLARGGQVWLRVAATSDGAAVTPRAPVAPIAPRAPVYGGATPMPGGRMPRYAGTVPVPPPPALPGVGRTSVTTQPRVIEQPGVYREPVVPQPPPVYQPPFQDTPVEEVTPFAEPQPDAFVATDFRRRIGLPCERGQGRWHIRPVGGAAFWLGDDESDVDIYGGIDIGRTFAGCFGVDAFYRYSAGTFDRQITGGILEDAGAFHHAGIKGTYMSSLDGSGRLFAWAGIGVAYFWSQDLQIDDDGVSGFAEIGLGYALTDAIRLRLGLNLHAMDTEAGRFLASDDPRVLWTLAPTLGLELDL